MSGSTDPMMELVLRVPEMLTRAVEFDRAAIPRERDIVLLGMGGSGMAAAAAALGGDAGPQLVYVHQGYDLPGWAKDREALVVAVSFSGNTEEVVSGVERALDVGLPVVAVSSGGRLGELAVRASAPHVIVEGGMQPRAALGSLAAATLHVLEAAGAVDDSDRALEEAATAVADCLGDGTGAGFRLGEDLASAFDDRVPIVVGARGPGALAARRWMTQINENAKRVAMALEVPEANHNALEAWVSGAAEPVGFGLVALDDRAAHPRCRRRMELTIGALVGRVRLAGEVMSAGVGNLARFMSLVSVGDVASVAMAQRSGGEATPVDALENFKKLLREEST